MNDGSSGVGDKALPGRDDSAHKGNGVGSKVKDEEAGYEPGVDLGI